MRRVSALLCGFFLALGETSYSQREGSDLSAYLAGVTERGRALYEYDQAAWHGTDAFLALNPQKEGLTHYICMKTATGWQVAFPAWNAKKDRLYVLYEALQADLPGKYEARRVNPPREANADLVAKENALELAIGDFPRQNRAYNTAILPGPEGSILVYVYPAQTVDTVWPIGGDVRYTISADGRKIVEERQLHKTILDMEYKPENNPTAGFHTHILSDVPEDTDVFYVLNRRPLIPEFIIITPEELFKINTDGTIEPAKPCEKTGPVPCKEIQKLDKFKKP